MCCEIVLAIGSIRKRRVIRLNYCLLAAAAAVAVGETQAAPAQCQFEMQAQIAFHLCCSKKLRKTLQCVIVLCLASGI